MAEILKCTGCGYMHPPPVGERCPVKISRSKMQDEKGKIIYEFVNKLGPKLETYDNYSALIAGITKLIDLKGIKSKR